MCQPVIHSLLECIGGSREEGEGRGAPLFAGAESARTWAAGVAERANQAPGMCSVGVRTGGQVEGGGMKEVGMKKTKWQICSAARGSGCGARACTSSAACGQNARKERDGRTDGRAGGRPPSCRQRSGMRPLYLPSFFRFASTGEAERHDVTY